MKQHANKSHDRNRIEDGVDAADSIPSHHTMNRSSCINFGSLMTELSGYDSLERVDLQYRGNKLKYIRNTFKL